MDNLKLILVISFFIILLGVHFHPIILDAEKIKDKWHGYVLVWMGLEVVGENVQESLNQLMTHKNSINAVSYEAYYLGANGTFSKRIRVTDVTDNLRQTGVELWPMITSTNITRMRILFNNPDSFITTAVKTAIERNFTGYNVDFEPESATDSDAYAYVNFLNRFADALHAVNKKLSVDIATWSVFWNYDMLAQSKVDMFCEMATYAGRFETFYSALNYALSKMPQNRLVIGLETLNPNTGETIPFSESEVEVRLRSIIKSNLNKIAIWRTPLPEYWWPLVDDIKNGFNITLKTSNPNPVLGSNVTVTTTIFGGIPSFTYSWKINNATIDCTTSTCTIIINTTNPYIITLTATDSLYISITKTLTINPTTSSATTQQSIPSSTQSTSPIIEINNQLIIVTLGIIILLIILAIKYKKLSK
ncbi:MAG: hypothetical protein QW128_08990 [Thermoprotei archaeon]